MEEVKLFIRFLKLVKKYFRKEHSIDFYAKKLGVEAEELSRIIWETSDSNLLDWIKLLEKVHSGKCRFQGT